ncbi:MAG TPA: helix-turn-helix transcriptional regulator [Hyphomicrobiaceae bacterium]|nr:helix-turn-helix transcriptional regulator [Hyphomicrobiaceae bacterium]
MVDSADDGEALERGTRRPNPIDVHVGNRVRLQRMLIGISQEKLGERLGLTFQQVQKYEKGINRIGASRLFELSRVLGVPVQFFYDDAPASGSQQSATPGFAERSSDSHVFEFLSSREGLELNRAFSRITDPKVRKSVLDLVRSLAEEASDGSYEPPSD